MTLRQKMLLKELPKNNYNVSKTAKKVGYSEQYANKSIYTVIGKNRLLEKFYNEDNVKKEIKKALKDFVKNKDNTNRSRMLELISKIQGLITEKHQDVPVDKDSNQFSLDRLAGIKKTETQ